MQSMPASKMQPIGQAGVRAHPFAQAAYVLGLVFLPANAAISVGVLGEARSEPFILCNLLILPLVLPILVGRITDYRPIYYFALSFFVATAVSVVANLGDILGASLKGRDGLSRVVSTALVPLFGFYCSAVVAYFSGLSFQQFFAKPIIIAAIIVTVVADVELMTWFSDAIRSVYLVASQVMHSLLRRGHYVEGRIHSVTYEASNFGMYVIFTLPWLLAIAKFQRTLLSKAICFAIFVNLVTLSFISGRTSLMGVIPSLLMFSVCLFILQLRRQDFLICCAGVLIVYLSACILPIAGIILYEGDIAAAALSAEGVSSLSRFGTIVVQMQEFLSSPVFGVGMGQYPFSLHKFIPAWAMTWEVRAWMTDPEASFFPSFSLPARILAELGMAGYIVWLGFSSFFLVRVLSSANAFFLRSHRRPLVAAAIAASFFGLALMGWTVASYRVPYIWLTFGLAVAYIMPGGSNRLETGPLPSPNSSA